MPEKVALIGSGNWGSAIATKIGKNVLDKPDMFDATVYMWVFEEYVKEVDGKFSRRPAPRRQAAGGEDVGRRGLPAAHRGDQREARERHLPSGHRLPAAVMRAPTSRRQVTGATMMMVFVIPHNFLAPIVPKMEGAFAPGAVGCSLIKGIEFEAGTPILISDLLQKEMAKGPPARRPSTCRC